MAQKSCISCRKQLTEIENVCPYCGALQSEEVAVFIPKSEIKKPEFEIGVEDQRSRSFLKILSGLYFHPTSTLNPALFQSYRLSTLIILIIAVLNTLASFCFYQGIYIEFRVDTIPSFQSVSLELIFGLILLGATFFQFLLQFFSWFICSLILWVLLMVFGPSQRDNLNLEMSVKILGLASVPWILISVFRLVVFGAAFISGGTGHIVITSSQWWEAFLQFFVQLSFVNTQFDVLFDLIALILAVWTSYLIYRCLRSLNSQTSGKKDQIIAIAYGFISCIVFLLLTLPIFSF
ncbi:MAG: hypothetical protein ACFFC7_12370 [Candidatus Hermodarchaeota archaeon]